jgi:hypothetical protein
MSALYLHADGTGEMHYQRNARLAGMLYRKLRDGGLPPAEASEAGAKLLRSLDSETGVKRNYDAWVRV